MKKILLVVPMLLIACFAFAQGEEYNDKQNMEVVTTRQASYPGGDMALYKFILKNINYSEESIEKYIEGEVMVSFNVQPDGSVTNPIVLSGIGYGIDEEVTRLLKTLKFEPSIRNGLKVKQNLVHNFPVRAHKTKPAASETDK